ncbi:MAG: hypothetical protein M0R03_04900 [Novosphingobium sp.]|nr:hypothetical protein [Novosphingobium sp.]
MIARMLWIALLIAVAAVAVAVHLDRQSRVDPFLAKHVPAPFRYFAQGQVAVEAIDSGDAASMLEEGRRLVRRRPLPAGNLLLLAIAQEQAGHHADAARSMQAAARRGWRIPEVQHAGLLNAVAAGAMDEAGYRLAALWALSDDAGLRDTLTRTVLADPAAAEAFGGILGGSPGWRNRFLARYSAADAPPRLVEAVAAANRAGTDFDCAALSALARSFALRGNAASARTLWSGKCARRGHAAEPGGAGFTPEPDGAPGPFDWSYGGQPGLTVSAGDAGLDYDNRTFGTQLVASRLVSLSPGNRLLTLTSAGGGGLIEVRIACGDASGRKSRLASRVGEGALPFTVNAASCPIAEISVHGGRGSRRGLTLTLR